MPKLANRISNKGDLEVTSVEQINSGDRLIVKSGEIVPVDGVAAESCYLDQSALTGEPLPILLSKSDSVISGTLNAGNAFGKGASTAP